MAYVVKNFTCGYEVQFALSGTVGRLTKSGNIYYRITGPGGTPNPASDPTYSYDTVSFLADYIVKINANQQGQFVTDELDNRYVKINQTEETLP